MDKHMPRPVDKYLPIGKGQECIKNGEFLIADYDALFKAAADFIAQLGGKPQEVDTGFMGIKGPILLDARDAGIDHKKCGWPRIVKFKLDSRQEGDIARVLYSFDHIDALDLVALFKRNNWA